MIQALIQRWLAGQDPSAPEARQKCGARAGMVGILLNTLLCLGKLAAGMITGSVAIVADALNNLSDAASSVITLVGFRLAGQAADEEHPFGHGRMEYLTGLVVSMAILLMGFGKKLCGKADPPGGTGLLLAGRGHSGGGRPGQAVDVPL